MESNIEDPLHLGVDFEHTEDVVIGQSDITLEHSGHDQEIPMEFENSEGQTITMETESEEIIDYISDPLTLQELVQSQQHMDLATIEPNSQLSCQETMIDLNFDTQTSINSATQEVPTKIINVKAFTPATSTSIKKADSGMLTTVRRQIPIAPKPPALALKVINQKPFSLTTSSPKPVTLIANKVNQVTKKVSVGNVVQGNIKGNSVLAQIGKQFIMMPSNAQKIKLVSTSGTIPTVQYVKTTADQSQLLTPNISGIQAKPVTKLIKLQGPPDLDASNQPAVITKIMPVTNAKSPQPRFVTVQQNQVPINVGNKVLLATSSKQPVKIGKKQEIISLKPPPPPSKIMPALAPASNTTKHKVLISANPTQNVVIKPAPATKITKDTNVIIEGQQTTQLHQINVPGKGVQYIRLVTSGAAKSSPVITVPKTFVIADNKVNPKPQQKLVRIAPVASKPAKTVPQQRSGQSLLAPLSPVANKLPELDKMEIQVDPGPDTQENIEIEMDSKAALQALINSTRDIKQEHNQSQHMRSEALEHDSNRHMEEKPLIVIPGNYNDVIVQEDRHSDDDHEELNAEESLLTTCQSPTPPSEPDFMSNELDMRPRKACNCTKSQCLKLYCDCFANGEFCNQCNCNNCHNNLENEELRQKAIRGCLERNPNAFRPKIGKSKSAGPDIIRRHNKGCNCKRSGCLKNYCECYEAKIACTSICKCVGCRNVEDSLERSLRYEAAPPPRDYCRARAPPRAPHHLPPLRQPCTFMTSEVIEAVCQCLVAAAAQSQAARGAPARDVLEEFARCLQDIIAAAHQPAHTLLDEAPA